VRDEGFDLRYGSGVTKVGAATDGVTLFSLEKLTTFLAIVSSPLTPYPPSNVVCPLFPEPVGGPPYPPGLGGSCKSRGPRVT